MKRFHCLRCKKLRRQRRWPPDAVNTQADTPTERLGTCDVCRELAQRAAKITRTFRVHK